MLKTLKDLNPLSSSSGYKKYINFLSKVAPALGAVHCENYNKPVITMCQIYKYLYNLSGLNLILSILKQKSQISFIN